MRCDDSFTRAHAQLVLTHTPRFRTHQYSRRAAMFQKYYEWTCEAAAREYAVKAHAEKAEVAAMAEYMVNAIQFSCLCEGGHIPL